ncbi:MAG: hypothetical protein ACXWP5_15330 [Bdellovibrionota bacterium]
MLIASLAMGKRSVILLIALGVAGCGGDTHCIRVRAVRIDECKPNWISPEIHYCEIHWSNGTVGSWPETYVRGPDRTLKEGDLQEFCAQGDGP